MTRRLERVNELIREEVGQLIQRSVRDPRVHGLISIVDVQTSPDLSRATIHVSSLGSETERAAAVAGLRQAAGYLRRELRGRLDLRQVPALDFRLDDTIVRGSRILELLGDIDGEPT